MEYVSVKNFSELQHRSVKGAAWIKLYTSIADDYELSLLPEQSRLLYFYLLTLAAFTGNKITTDRRWLADRLHLPELRRESIDLLIRAGFLLPYEHSATSANEPVEATEPVATAEDQTPTPARKSRSKKIDPAAIYDDPLFGRFWDIYPRKDAKVRAAEAWGRLVRDGVIDEAAVDAIVAAITRNIELRVWRVSELKFIPLPSSWLNGRRWEDQSSSTTQPSNTQPLRLAI